MISLTVEKRENLGKKIASARTAGMLPAVVYGPKQKSTPIILSRKEFEHIFKEVGESSVIELKGLDVPLQVLIYDVDYDPVTSVVRHVDFYATEKGAKVQVAVPIIFIGESPAIKSGASLVKVLHEIEIEAEATKIPHDITVDISILKNIEDQIRVGDITFGTGVKPVTEPEEVVILVQEIKEEVIDTPDMDAIAVEKKGKEEEENKEEDTPVK